jgi:hypothetical protein
MFNINIFVSNMQLCSETGGVNSAMKNPVFVMTNSASVSLTPIGIQNKTSANMDKCLDFV